MSIAAVFPVIQRPWKGYTDRGLPVGMWVAQGTVTGDASAGQQGIFFVFKGEGEPLGARFYNIEQVEVHSTQANLDNAGMSLNNFDIIGQTGLVNRLLHVSLESDAITNTGIISGDLRLPIFLGRPQLVDLEAQVEVRTINTLNETLFATIQGYIWEPRSLLEDGGLRRPLDSLYR